MIARRTNVLLLVLILAVGGAIVAMLASGARGGPLDPPNPPAATGTLPQAEPRMPIPPVGWSGTFPIVISQPGSYFLTRNIVGVALAPTWNGIEIMVSDVALDLNGFSILADNTGLNGVFATAAVQRVKVSNGKVAGWNGVGINLSNATDSTVTDVMTTNNSKDGIVISTGGSVTDCISNNNGLSGVAIYGSGSTVSDCLVAGDANGIFEVSGTDNTIVRNVATSNTGAGYVAYFSTRLTMTQNIARNNTGLLGNYNVADCTSCDLGPIGTAALATSHWANISD
jgi:parallel beta-helix repeat protein